MSSFNDNRDKQLLLICLQKDDTISNMKLNTTFLNFKT